VTAALSTSTDALGGIDHRLLNAELRLFAGDRGMPPRRRRPWAWSSATLKSRLVDPRQQLTGPDTLVVTDKHFMEVAPRPWGATVVLSAFHISVIGRDQIAAERSK